MSFFSCLTLHTLVSHIPTRTKCRQIDSRNNPLPRSQTMSTCLKDPRCPDEPQPQLTELERADRCVRWLSHATQRKGLRGFAAMLASFKPLQHAQLAGWSAASTSAFLKGMRRRVRPYMAGSTRKVMRVLAVTDLAGFMEVYDAFAGEASAEALDEQDRAFLETFFEYCHGYEFVLTRDAASAARELAEAKSYRWWLAKVASVADALSCGVPLLCLYLCCAPRLEALLGRRGSPTRLVDCVASAALLMTCVGDLPRCLGRMSTLCLWPVVVGIASR